MLCGILKNTFLIYIINHERFSGAIKVKFQNNFKYVEAWQSGRDVDWNGGSSWNGNKCASTESGLVVVVVLAPNVVHFKNLVVASVFTCWRLARRHALFFSYNIGKKEIRYRNIIVIHHKDTYGGPKQQIE
jgi:hypothetical protein